MDIILVPGFWLDGAAWDEVTPVLTQAGHTPRPVTLPGLESVDAGRSGVTLSDHVDAVVRAIDAADGPVVLVGHSAGGGLVYAAADRRPDRVARVIYVDSGPFADGQAVNSELPGDVVDQPLPGWDEFEDGEPTGLTDDQRARFRERAVPQPAATAREPHQLTGDAEVRRAIPATVIACLLPSELLRELMAHDHPFVRELKTLKDYEIVDLPTGHWPMFTRPVELGGAIAAALR
ncbi:alpha/beta fold hydrolase [Isoptericola croceus]|uniref:alpha/beta fold hydrolase n=1 Tax=Isoptericola croceus TaxID=3031406 RepID=UPI0023F861FC|nr:alpha/beta hydrolase [Isoptericola croceus]